MNAGYILMNRKHNDSGDVRTTVIKSIHKKSGLVSISDCFVSDGSPEFCKVIAYRGGIPARFDVLGTYWRVVDYSYRSHSYTCTQITANPMDLFWFLFWKIRLQLKIKSRFFRALYKTGLFEFKEGYIPGFATMRIKGVQYVVDPWRELERKRGRTYAN